MNRSTTSAALLVVLLLVSVAAHAQLPIEYVYDALGRLVGVIDPSGDSVMYTYDATGNLTAIARHASTTVSIITFSPSSGLSGTTVTIRGTGFSATPSENTVTFNGTAATVSSSAATQIVATVPGGAATGPIAVTSPSGSATSSASFTVTATSSAPTISSFSPTVGAVGDAATITGTNYETTPANNKVTLNVRTRAPVTTSTAITLGITVPAGGTSGHLSVATPGGTVTSTGDFFVPPSPYTAANVSATGRISVGGSSLTVSLPTANKIALVVFDATAGQRLSLGFSSVTIGGGIITIANPDGTQLASAGFNITGGAIDTAPLTQTGTYTALVASNPTSYTGNMTLTLSEEVTGTIAIGGAAVPVSITRPGQRARITFSGTAGQRLSLLLDSTTINSGSVSILNPDGSQLGQTTFGSGANTLDPPALPATGTYTILVDPTYAYTGTTTLTLSEELTGTITVDGAAVTVTITRPGQRERLTFGGTAGQRLSLGWTSSTLGGGAFVTIYNPDGSVSVSQYFGGNSAMDTPALPSTGTYTLLVDPYGNSTGSATLTLSSEVTGTLTIGGAGTSVSITRPGQRARLTFSGTAGHRVSANHTSNTITTGWVTLYNPDGSTLTTQYFYGTTTFVEPKTTATTGTYTFLVNPDAAYTGSLTITLYDVLEDVTGTLTVNGAAQTVTTTAPGQKGVLTFTGNASTQYTVHGANSTQGCMNLLVKRPDNATTSISPCTASYSLSTTSSTAGTFTVTVDPTGINTGSVDLNVTTP